MAHIGRMRWIAIAAAFAAAWMPTPPRAEVVTIGTLKLDFDDKSLHPKGEAQVEFVRAYLAARAKKDGNIEHLIHSTGLACPDTPEQRYLNADFTRRKREPITDNAKLIFVPPPEGEIPFSFPEFVSTPVKPLFVLGISWSFMDPAVGSQPARRVESTVIEQVADDKGKLRIVRGCLTEKGAEQVRKKLATQPQPPR